MSDEKKTRTDLKADFFRHLAKLDPQQALLPSSDRGVGDAIDLVIKKLEANNPIADPLHEVHRPDLLGSWQLVYASRGTVVTRRLVTMPNFDNGIQIKRVWQILASDVNQGIRAENGAQLEFFGLGTLELKALGKWSWTQGPAAATETVMVTFDAFTFKLSRMFRKSSWNGSPLKIPILEVLRNEASWTTSYLDETLRIGRGATGNLFVFRRE